MKKKNKKFAALILAAATSMSLLSGCGGGNNPAGETTSTSSGGTGSSDTYTYTFASIDSVTTWNSHDAQIVESITDYTEIPLWNLVLNDTADGYDWSPEMAVGEPEDVTGEYAGNEQYGIPADATEGYAYRITLNPDAKWEDGSAITADDYMYSMQQMLNPEMHNYDAYGFYQTLPIAGAEAYAKSGQTEMVPVVDVDTNEYADYGDAALYISFTQVSSAFWGYSGVDYYTGSEDYYVNEAGEDLMDKYGNEDYVAVTDEVIADINYMLTNFWGEEEVDPENYLTMAFYEASYGETSFDSVGFLKTGDYELTIILRTPLTPFYFKYNCDNLALVNEEKYEAGKTQTGDMVKTDYGTSVDTYMSSGPYKLVSFQPDKEWRVTRNENWYGWTDGKHDGLYQATDIVCTIVEDSATQEQLFLQGKLSALSLNAENLDKYLGSDYIVYTDNSYMYYLNINNDKDLLASRETEGVNKTILTYLDFRKGISLAMNRNEYIAMQGYGKAAYGYYSDYYVYDVDTGERYRDSEPAIQTLKTFYGVDDVDEITGYDLDAAKAALVSGYEQALADGVVSETDQFVFDYPTWSNETSDLKQVQFMQDSLDAATEGTALEGRITVNMVVSEDYYGKLDSGEYELSMSAWTGDATNPYANMESFVTDDYSPQAYFGFDPQTETLDIDLNGTTITKTYYDWYQELLFGEYAVADADTRNQILASMELALLQKYRDCPFWGASTAVLESMQIAYPTYEPVFAVNQGGIRCMTFNYTDVEWADFCAENNNQLNYQ